MQSSRDQEGVTNDHVLVLQRNLVTYIFFLIVFHSGILVIHTIERCQRQNELDCQVQCYNTTGRKDGRICAYLYDA